MRAAVSGGLGLRQACEHWHKAWGCSSLHSLGRSGCRSQCWHDECWERLRRLYSCCARRLWERDSSWWSCWQWRLTVHIESYRIVNVKPILVVLSRLAWACSMHGRSKEVLPLRNVRANSSPWDHQDSRRSVCRSQVQRHFQMCCLSKCQKDPAGTQ
jgi:hypothetical protein